MAVSHLLLRKWKFSKDIPSYRSNYRQQLKSIILGLIEKYVAQCNSKKISTQVLYLVRKCPINISCFRLIANYIINPKFVNSC